MAKVGDSIEKSIDESMPFLFERLGDLTALLERGCLTVGQCALLMPGALTYGQQVDPSQMAAHYVMLAFLDIRAGTLCAKHPETWLPYAEYLRMNEAGMFGDDGSEMPIPTAGWLVDLDDAEQWIRSKGISINLDGLKADLVAERLRAAESAAIITNALALEDADAELAALFDPVPVAALEKMFPADGTWADWCERASRYPGLLRARVQRGRFNPYLAGMWFLNRGADGWDQARILRKLADNLPARSRDKRAMLSGDMD